MKNLENTIKQMLLENGSAAFARMFGGGAASTGARAVRPRPGLGRGSRRPGESPEPMSPEESGAFGVQRTDLYGGGGMGGMGDMVIPQSASDMFGIPATPTPRPPQMGGASRMGGGQQPPPYMDPGFSPTPMRPQPEVPTMLQAPEQSFSMVPQQPQMGGQGMGMPQDPMVAAAADQISQQAAKGNMISPKPAGMGQDPMAMPGQQVAGMGGAPQPRQPQGGPSSATVSAQDQLGALNEPTMFDGMPQPQAQQPPMGGQGMGMPQQPPMGRGMPQQPPMGRGMPQPQAVPTAPMPKAPPVTGFDSPMPQGGMSPEFSMTPQPQLQRTRTPRPTRPPQTQPQAQRQRVAPRMATATKTARPGGIGFNFGGEETPFSASDAMLRYGRGGQSQMLDPTMPTEYSQEANLMDMERMKRKQMFRQQIAQRSFQNPGMAYESFIAENDKKKNEEPYTKTLKPEPDPNIGLFLRKEQESEIPEPTKISKSKFTPHEEQVANIRRAMEKFRSNPYFIVPQQQNMFTTQPRQTKGKMPYSES